MLSSEVRPSVEPPLISKADCIRITGLGRRQFDAAVMEGHIKTFKLDGRDWVVRESALRFLEELRGAIAA